MLIAETGGQNAMIVDSSALPEQVVLDAVQSGFNSAGQRCSALRVLFVQDEIAPRICNLLAGYMDELVIGDPLQLSTDVGPVIDEASRDMLRAARGAHRQVVALASRLQARAGARARPVLCAARGRNRIALAAARAKCSGRRCTSCATRRTSSTR